MHRLEDQYGEQVAFFHLDVDMPAEDDVRSELGITGRSQYLLLDSNGKVAAQWFGPITFEQVSAEIEALLTP